MDTNKKQKKIFVVEDDAAMREIVTHKLLTNGFEVKQAEDGKKALEMLEKEMPDLILLDLMIPEVDGFSVLQTVRKSSNPEFAKTPVIILSNLWSNKDILRTQALQIQAYMVKAYFTTEEILSKINEILASKGQATAPVSPNGK
jgi:DNA-binding response OmpR family regulator